MLSILGRAAKAVRPFFSVPSYVPKRIPPWYRTRGGMLPGAFVGLAH